MRKIFIAVILVALNAVSIFAADYATTKNAAEKFMTDRNAVCVKITLDFGTKATSNFFLKAENVNSVLVFQSEKKSFLCIGNIDNDIDFLGQIFSSTGLDLTLIKSISYANSVLSMTIDATNM